MSGKVLKAGQAQAGDAIILNARLLPRLDAAGYIDDADTEELEPGYGVTGLGEDTPEIFEAKSQAQEILDLASAQANRIISAAEDEGSQILADAQEQAAALIQSTTTELDAKRAEMERSLHQQLSAQYSQRYLAAVTALEAAAQDLRAKQEEYLEQIEQPAFQLVLAIAKQLIGGELNRAPELLGAMVAQAFHLLKPEQVALVAVHPQTFECLAMDEMLNSALNQAGIKPERVELEIDETLRPDQFSLRLGGMRLDYDLSAAIAEMIEHLEERSRQL